MFLSPAMIALLVVSAASSFLVFSYLASDMVRRLLLHNLPELYATYGVQGLSPAYAIMNMFEINFLALLPFLLLVAAPLGYGISNIVADDVGALPEVLLFSRPMSRWKFLLGNFIIRSAIILLVTFVIPFLVVYSSAVSVMANTFGSYISTKIPLDQWVQMAWGSPLAELLALYSTVIMAISALILFVSVLSRRGAVTIPLALFVVGIYPIISMGAAFLAVPVPNAIGWTQSPLALAILLTSPFRVFTSELSYSYSFSNIVATPTAWCIFLLVLSLLKYNKAQQKS
jgi:hypothetical protein